MARRLAPRAGKFRAAHPDWTLRQDASDEVVDIDSDADAAIRYGTGNSFGYDLVYSARAAERPATRLLREWVKAAFAG